jgi:hypothetical protein
MKQPRVTVWTGGQPEASEGCFQLAEALPALPPPAPLRRSALVEFSWGAQQFQFLAVACSVRTTPWGGESVAWVHCKGQQTAIMRLDEPTELIDVLIPAHYVTALEPNTTFQILRSRPSDGPAMGVFPPNQPAPAAALPLAQIERVIADLRSPALN